MFWYFLKKDSFYILYHNLSVFVTVILRQSHSTVTTHGKFFLFYEVCEADINVKIIIIENILILIFFHFKLSRKILFLVYFDDFTSKIQLKSQNLICWSTKWNCIRICCVCCSCILLFYFQILFECYMK